MSVIFTFANHTYTFRNPLLGNQDTLTFQRVQRRSRGGDLIVFRDAEWPKTETLNLTFDFQEEAEYRRLLNFIRVSIGETITYIDHESVTWSGVIQNPDAQGTQAGRNSWVVTFVFEGDMV